MRRVVVTGMGVVSAYGLGLAPFWEGLREGKPAITPLRTLNTEQLKFSTGAEFASFNPNEHLDPDNILLADRNAQFALLAAREATKHSGQILPEDAGIVAGCCVGGKHIEDQGYWDVYRESKPRVHPLTIPKVMANSAASLIAMDQKIRGPVFTTSTACSSANHAIGQALWLLRQGTADVALAGGSEAPFVFGLAKAWEAMRVVSPDTCRPFSADRRGMILGEGAAFLVLEELERAKARGAVIYAELAGFGMSADATHITQPNPAGAAQAMRLALRDARLEPEAIGYINAHGTGTLANDPSEILAVKTLFGPHSQRLAISSTKSMHGHALGAAGALEAVATVCALIEGTLPPTANHTTPDPQCDLDVIPNAPRRASIEAALSNSFAFGGLNAVLAFRRLT